MAVIVVDMKTDTTSLENNFLKRQQITTWVGLSYSKKRLKILLFRQLKRNMKYYGSDKKYIFLM